MVKEAYCSFEVAKLLKEKGFNWDCSTYYEDSDPNYVQYSMLFDNNTTWEKGCCSAPTHQMAIAWLREVHKLHIAIWWDCGAYIGKNSFCYHIDELDNYENKGYNKIGFDSYEETIEAAIKYCLENLI